MPVETALSFLRVLAQGRALCGVFVISGPQAFLREYVLEALRSRLTREGRQYRTHQLGSADDLGAALNDLSAPDLFAAKKVVVCRIPRSRRGQEAESDESDRESRSGASEPALVTAIERGGFAGELILVYDRDSAPAKIRRLVERDGIVINCLRPFDNQLAHYAQAFALVLGLKPAPDAIDVLVSCYASDLAAMANALSKAALHLGKGERLKSADLLEPGAARTPELFDLAESLARGQTSLTLALLDRAIAVGRDVFEILAVEIIPVVRRMLLAAAMLERGRGGSDVASALGLSPASSLATRTIDGARRFKLGRLRRAHRQLCALDAQFKMGLRREREAAVSEVLIELMAPASG